MIKSKAEMASRGYEIDLTGPDGNAYALMSHASNIGKQLGFSKNKIDAIIKVMMMTNYEGLVHTFDVHFGEHVVLWR